nr:hypothetical protein DY000_00015822 [Ipomoea batatas]GMD70565.1 hypothetical protein DY000_00015822 [Ipomoea batatas]
MATGLLVVVSPLLPKPSPSTDFYLRSQFKGRFENQSTYKLDGKRNGQPFIDEYVTDIGKSASKELDEGVGASGSANPQGFTAEPLEAEPSLADERAGVAARFRIEPTEDLNDQLIG